MEIVPKTMERDRVAALLTCFNRKAKTLACLEALYNQKLLANKVSIEVYLVDDGSNDGTTEAVSQAFPQVHIRRGTGNLFWNGGMRQAFTEAIKQDYDFYLWLNDDTLLYPHALTNLLDTHQSLTAQGHPRPLISGSTQDADTGELTYGGVIRRSLLRPIKFDLLEPGDEAKPCDTINGNCVLIPRSVVEVVGNLDPAFTHYAGDWDYGLRARKQGCTVWISPGYVGTCSRNYVPGVKRPPRVKASEGLKKIAQPKGLPFEDETLHPLNEWKVFAQRYAGPFPLWIVYWLIPYRRLVWLSVTGLFRQSKTQT
ncbi:MAG: glycosyltransferase family 2 protein [Oscillatoria sp. PMC 1051.18]|nr:glycosyltransferase family 2 protein [Oscillatoria sp. PMC 1051.18]